MIRPWNGVQTLGSAAQPVFGTALTAASIFATDRYTGTNRPGTTTPPVTLAVASSIGFQVNDHVQVGPKVNFTTANRKLLDHGTVAGIVDPTHISVQGLLQNHASGEYVVLDETASMVQIIPVGTSNPIYLGTDSTASAADPYIFDVIAQTSTTTSEPTYWHTSPSTGTSDSYQTSQYWVNGTDGNQIVARFSQG